MSLLVCIPAYNEAKNIGELIQKTLKFTKSIVVCDDGSSDKTSEIAKKSGAFVIRHNSNKGKGSALKSLFNYAKNSDFDVIVTIDGDGQFMPEEIPKLIKPIQHGSSDIVIGYRFQDENDMPKYRKIGNKILDHASSIASELSLRDTQSGFRSYSKKAIETITFTNTGFSADSEIIIDAARKGLKISEERVSVLYNTGGKTSTINPIHHGISVFGSLIELILIKNPLKYLGIPGFFLILFGIISSAYVMSLFNESRYFSIPFTLLTIVLLIVGLMLILVSGILYAINRNMKDF